MLTSALSFLTAPFSSKITIPAEHTVNADILAWLAARGLAKGARELALLDHGTSHPTYDDDESSDEDVPEAETGGSQAVPLNFIPDFGHYRFRHNGYFMTMERRNHKTRDEDGRATVDLDPTSPRIVTLKCFPTLCGTRPIKRFLKDVRGFSNLPKENKTTVFALPAVLLGVRADTETRGLQQSLARRARLRT